MMESRSDELKRTWYTDEPKKQYINPIEMGAEA